MSREQEAAKLPDGRRRWWRLVVTVVVYGCLLALGHWGSRWLLEFAGADMQAAVQAHAFHVMLVGIAFYAVLMAIPFVPGMEISLALIALFGPTVALAIYVATVAALVLSYLIGRLMPVRLIAAFFGFLGLQRAQNLVQSLAPLKAAQRIELLMERAPKRIVPFLLKHRYIAVIVSLNLPGNAIIGGGGGIALLAGMSGLFSFPLFLLSVALAVLPVPLFVVLSGT